MPKFSEGCDRHLESLSDYVLVSQKHVRVERYRRQADGTWLLMILGKGAHLVLDAVGTPIHVDRMYLKVSLPAASQAPV